MEAPGQHIYTSNVQASNVQELDLPRAHTPLILQPSFADTPLPSAYNAVRPTAPPPIYYTTPETPPVLLEEPFQGPNVKRKGGKRIFQRSIEIRVTVKCQYPEADRSHALDVLQYLDKTVSSFKRELESIDINRAIISSPEVVILNTPIKRENIVVTCEGEVITERGSSIKAGDHVFLTAPSGSKNCLKRTASDHNGPCCTCKAAATPGVSRNSNTPKARTGTNR